MKGGKRPNAVRKPIEETRVTLAVRVKRETKAELSDMAKTGNTSIGRVIVQSDRYLIDRASL